MAELKNTFRAGKMNKDLDERIVPNGEYRDALNIEVSTSEDSNVGAAQTVLGNRQVTDLITYSQPNTNTFGYIVNEKNDTITRLIASKPKANNGVGIDRIMEYRATSGVSEVPVVVDIYSVEGQYTAGLSQTSFRMSTNSAYIRPGMRFSLTDNTGAAVFGFVQFS